MPSYTMEGQFLDQNVTEIRIRMTSTILRVSTDTNIGTSLNDPRALNDGYQPMIRKNRVTPWSAASVH